MGEAKKRGTPEERRSLAEASQEKAKAEITDIFEAARMVAFILDRSARGRTVLTTAVRNVTNFEKNFGKRKKWWEDELGEFLIYLSSITGEEGAFVIIADDKEKLMNEALPAMVKKIGSLGGLCAFMVGVDPTLEPEIRARIAELRPDKVSIPRQSRGL